MKQSDLRARANCPEAKKWALIAAGQNNQGHDDALLKHCSACAECAERLRDLLDAIADDCSDGGISEAREMRVTAMLAAETFERWPEQRLRELARRMAGTKERKVGKVGKGSGLNNRWMGLAAMLALALGVGLAWLTLKKVGRPPLSELAAVYTSHRNLELQIPGAANAPLRVERGGGAATIGDLPPALLESQAKIQKHLAGRPDDTAWLHAEGRAALLTWDCDRGIRAFQTAADLGEKSADFFIDFAIAYYERAEKNAADNKTSTRDYGLALEELGRALEQDPGNLPALFNRAVIRTKLYQYDPAAADFEEYVRRQKDAGWRDEAARRLANLRRKRALVFGPGAYPNGDLARELALEDQMTSGLRRAFSRRRGRGFVGDLALAETLARENGDHWLLDVGSLPRGNGAAVSLLSELAQNRALGGGKNGSNLQPQVQELRERRLPAALRTWLDYEDLYRQTRTEAVGHCADSTPVQRASALYPWFRAQILLESSLCAAGRQDFSMSFAQVDRSGEIAKANRYPDTAMRVRNYRGQRLADTGFNSEALRSAVDAAGRLEESGYPIRRAYDFHVIVLKSATQMGLPQMALGATAMMAAVSQAAGTRIFEMIAYSQAAQLELILGNPDEAARKYDLARRLFGTFGESSEANVYWRVTQAGWLEAHRNREELYRILKEAKGQNPSGRDELYFTRKIVASLCRLELRAGHEDAVEALAVPFLNTAASVGKAQPGAIRAYLPEIETTATSLTTALLKAGRPEEALAAWHRFVGVRERLMGGGERVARPTRLEPGTAVLTVADLGGGAALWLTTSKSVEFTWAGSGYRHLIERIRLLSRLSRMDSAPESRIAKEARGIFAVLFPSGVKGISAVGVESSGEFNTLPLALFSYSDEGKNIAYSFLPFGGAVSTANWNADHITTVAATTFDHELTRGGEIAGSVDDEVESIAAKFVKRESIRGRAATARALDAAAGHDGVLHFAGHAIPWHGRVGLMVTPDARDSDADGRAGIWAMPRTKRMKSELVVFSACATGGFEDPGTIRPGQLTEAALLAGAGEAVATLWPVNSEATMAYMNLFYTHYVAGETVAAALRSASLEMRSTNRWKHPRYWAPFAVYSRLSGGITTNN